MNQSQSMMPQKNSSALKWLLVLLVLLILAGGGYYYWTISQKTNTTTATATPTPTATASILANYSSYTNSQYGFSFQYPSAWTNTKLEETSEPSGGTSTKDLVFKVTFSDPERKKDIEISNCLINEAVNWVNKTPTKESCTDKLAGLTAQQRKDLNTRLELKNIFVRVFKNSANSTLENWLIQTYKIAGSELGDYKVGSAISLGGKNGFISSVGCCSGTDISYVAKNGNYIYELGTNDPTDAVFEKSTTRPGGISDSFLDQISSTFQFTK